MSMSNKQGLTSDPKASSSNGRNELRNILLRRTTGPAKRSTKGEWTAEQDAILREAVERFNGNNWNQIAECLEGRDHSQCLHRWKKVLNPKLVKGPWTKEEDEELIKLVDKYGAKKWSKLAERINGRNGYQCRERWHNNLNPDIKKDAWTEEEDSILFEAHRVHGSKWAELAKLLPGRTHNAIKNRWNGVKKKLGAYEASGQLAQFGHTNQSTPSTQQWTGDDIMRDHIDEEVPECNQGATFVECSHSNNDMDITGDEDQPSADMSDAIAVDVITPPPENLNNGKDLSTSPHPSQPCDMGGSSKFIEESFSLDLSSMDTELYHPWMDDDQMMELVNDPTHRLLDSPSCVESPKAVPKTAAKTLTSTSSILKKRNRDLVSSLSGIQSEKKKGHALFAKDKKKLSPIKGRAQKEGSNKVQQPLAERNRDGSPTNDASIGTNSETPLRKSMDLPSTWNSPWSPFVPGERVDTDITIEDIDYFVSPGETPNSLLKERYSEEGAKSQLQESNISSERLALDFNECGSPEKGEQSARNHSSGNGELLRMLGPTQMEDTSDWWVASSFLDNIEDDEEQHPSKKARISEKNQFVRSSPPDFDHAGPSSHYHVDRPDPSSHPSKRPIPPSPQSVRPLPPSSHADNRPSPGDTDLHVRVASLEQQVATLQETVSSLIAIINERPIHANDGYLFPSRLTTPGFRGAVQRQLQSDAILLDEPMASQPVVDQPVVEEETGNHATPQPVLPIGPMFDL